MEVITVKALVYDRIPKHERVVYVFFAVFFF